MRDLHASHTLGDVGTATPKDRDEVIDERFVMTNHGIEILRNFVYLKEKKKRRETRVKNVTIKMSL